MEGLCRGDTHHLALAGRAQHPLDLARTIDRVCRNPAEGYVRGHSALDHARGQSGRCREANIVRDTGGFQTGPVVRPAFRKIYRAIDESVSVAGNVRGEDADLAVGDLTSGAGVLPRHAAGRLALLEKTVDPLRGSTIDHQHGVRVGQMFHDIPTDDVTQCIRAPAVAA